MSIHVHMWENIYFSDWKPLDNRHTSLFSICQLPSQMGPLAMRLLENCSYRHLAAQPHPMSPQQMEAMSLILFPLDLPQQSVHSKKARRQISDSAFSPHYPFMEFVTGSYLSQVSALLTYLK